MGMSFLHSSSMLLTSLLSCMALLGGASSEGADLGWHNGQGLEADHRTRRLTDAVNSMNKVNHRLLQGESCLTSTAKLSLAPATWDSWLKTSVLYYSCKMPSHTSHVTESTVLEARYPCALTTCLLSSGTRTYCPCR